MVQNAKIEHVAWSISSCKQTRSSFKVLNPFWHLPHQNGRWCLGLDLCSLASEVGMNLSKAETAILRYLDTSVYSWTNLFLPEKKIFIVDSLADFQVCLATFNSYIFLSKHSWFSIFVMYSGGLVSFVLQERYRWWAILEKETFLHLLINHML